MEEAFWTRRDIIRLFRKASATIDQFINHPDPKKRLKGYMINGEFQAGKKAVASGIPIRDVQAWLGHSDIQSTMIYAHHAPDANHIRINLLPY